MTAGQQPVPSPPQMSPDGRFWWDGQAWQPMPTAPSIPQQAPYGQAPYNPYAQAPYAPQPNAWIPYGQPPAGNGLSIAGIICGAIAFLFFPVLFGPIGLVLGGVALSRKEPKATIALAVAGTGTVVGMILGILAFSG